jgi:hypothetical protein
MAELDEFIKPRVEMDIDGDGENIETVWRVPFTQFLRPDGTPRAIKWTTPDKAVGEKAQAILDGGFHFTCEELMTGAVVFYITGLVQDTPDEDPEEGDAAIVVCMNGPAVPAKVAKMITDFRIPTDGVHKRYL